MLTKNLTYALSLLTAVLLAAFSGVARAASYVTFLESVSSPDTTGREQVYRLYFACDKTTYDGGYMDNELTAEAIMALLQELDADRIESVTVTSYASPEGVYEHNLMLSRLRGKCFESLAKTRFPLMNGHIRLIDGGEAWEPFRQQVFEDMQLDESVRVRILSLLDDDSVRGDTKKWRLQNRFGADTWRYILKNHFRYLRCVEIRIAYLDSARSIHTEATIPGAIQPDTTDTASQGIAGQDGTADQGNIAGQGNTTGQDTASQIIGGQGTVTSEVKTSTTTVYVFTDDDLLLTEAINADDQDLLVEIDEMSSVASYPRIPVTDAIENQPAVEQEIAPKAQEENEPVARQDSDSDSDDETLGDESGKKTERARKMIAALKTNLLFDVVTALNFEVEVPIANRYSFMVEDIFPWWETGNKYCLQAWVIGAEARVWLKSWERGSREKLRGFFAGPYVMSGKFDFQFDKDINYQGEMWSVGVTAGYAMPIGRRKRCNLEFSLSLGYMQAPFRHYQPTDDYIKLIKDPVNDGTFYNIFVYPTKAKISLVVPITVPKKEVSHD